MHYKLKLLFVIVIIVISNSSLSQIPTNGLVGYWPFSGNANDSSGNNLNGTVNGAVLTEDRFGNSSSAFNFDGIDDYILVNDDDLLSFPNNEFTFSFWVNPTLTQLPASPAFEEDFESINYWGGNLSFTVQYDKWVRHSGATPSVGTGPNGAQSGSKYRYYETSIPGDYHSVPYHGSMYSPAIDLTTSDSSELSFYFHAYGAKMGTLNVKVGSSSLGYTTVYTLSGQQQTSSSAPWQNVTVDLSAFLGEVVQLEFEYTSQIGQDCFTGDIAIDNITVSQSTQYYYSSEIGIMGKREFNQPYVNDWEYNVFGATDTTLGLVCWTNNGQNGVFGNGQSVLHSMNFTPGVWTNFIYSSDGDSLRYYKNGVKLGTIPKNSSGLNLSNQDGDLTFGLAGEWNQFRYLDGKLDDILMYDRALTQTEIDSISFMNHLPCSSVTGTDTRSECDSYTWIDGNTYTSSNNTATFNIANGAANGCDSIVTLDLTINSVYVTDSINISDGTSVTVGTSIYNNTGSYFDTLQTTNGCDSIINTVINVMDVNITQNDTIICFGDSISLSLSNIPQSNSISWTESYVEDFEDGQAQGWNIYNGGAGGQGVLNDNGNNVWGMTSDWNTFGRVIPGYPNSIGLALEFRAKNLVSGAFDGRFRCNISGNGATDDGYIFNYNSTNNVFNTINGITQNTNSTINANDWHTYRIEEIGANCKFYVDGILFDEVLNVDQSSMGDYMAFRSNSQVIWTNPPLRVYYDDIRILNPTFSSSTNTTYLWSNGDTTSSITVSPDSTTTYWVTQSQNGISYTDSVTVAVNQSTTSALNITECNNYTWNGTTYNSTGIYTWNGTNSLGCDSIVSLNLTITNNYTSLDTIVYYVSNVEFQSNSPKTYLESIDSTLSTNGGCDSIVLNYINYVFNPNNCTDTTFINSFDTTFITNYDTTFITVFDSILVLDSISIFDTTFINSFDTTLIINYDTSFITVFDSILVIDSISIYDTTFINTFDTTFITNYDTSFITVFDSILIIDSISIFDTTFINSFDTTFITNYDTTFITVFDSILVIDSISIFDTNFVTYYDTTFISSYDTNYYTIYDTITYYDSVLISVTDTLIINVNLSGISSPNNSNTLKIYPNPANDIVFIDNGNFNSMTNYNLKILNSFGQEVFNSFITIPQFQIPITSFGGLGLYYIQLYNDTGGLLEIRKLIIQ